MQMVYLSQTDKETLTGYYRTMREIAAKTTQPEERRALNASCEALYLALGGDASQLQGLSGFTNAIFGSDCQFLFVPFL